MFHLRCSRCFPFQTDAVAGGDVFRLKEKVLKQIFIQNVWNDMTVMEQVKMDAFFYLHLCIPGVLSTLKSELSMRA